MGGGARVRQQARVYLLTKFGRRPKPGLETGVGINSLSSTTLHKPPSSFFVFVSRSCFWRRKATLNAKGLGDNAPLVIYHSCGGQRGSPLPGEPYEASSFLK